jgi:RNA polymerase sigma-70 factor (ECF subfamily)
MTEVAPGGSGWNDALESMVDEPPSFEEFFQAERDRLFRVLCVITGSRQDAEDLSQDAFARMWERWDALAPIANPAGYLHRTAMNLLRSRYRRALITAKRVIGIVRLVDVYEAVDDRQVALQALREIPPRQRAAIVLTDVLGYTAEEAGQMLGVRPGTVRALHFQARSALKRLRETTDA